ncbi:MAG: tetratricopeptide repeat protein [Myxococcales bacterium]|nr:tetratricopeptide repeat protein [Myxococcales bacterium]
MTVEDGVDDWVSRWLDARQAACRATRIDGTETEAMLESRLACLEQRRRTLQVTLATWSSAEVSRGLTAHAEALLGRLPDLTDCSDPARLAEAEPLPAPGPARDAILAGYDRLNQARAWISVGEAERAEAIAVALTSDAAIVAHAPLRLEGEALRPQLDVTRGRIFAAVPRLIALAQEAEAHRLDVLAAELRVDAAEAAAGRWMGGSAESFVVDEAETSVRRLARPREPLRPRLLHARAALRLQAGDFAAALDGFREAEAEAIALVQPDRVERECWFIAATLGRLGRHAEARARLEAGRDQAEQRWGPGAPLVGAFEFDLAVLALESGDLGAVDRHLEAAAAIAREAFGADSLWSARIDYARAKARLAEGAFAEALTLVERAYPIYERELGADHELLAELHEARGVLRFFTGDLPGSLASYRAALTLARATLGGEHPTIARLSSNLGESQLALGRLAEADESFEAALAIYARSLPPDHPEVALPLKGRGQIALATGRPARAVEDLERALALQQRTGAEPLEIADLQFSLAQAWSAADPKRRPEARALALAAREAFDTLALDDRVRTIDAWLRR